MSDLRFRVLKDFEGSRGRSNLAGKLEREMLNPPQTLCSTKPGWRRLRSSAIRLNLETSAAKLMALSACFQWFCNTKALRTHILRILGPKTILYKAFGLF